MISNIDTLYISFDFYDYEKMMKNYRKVFEEGKRISAELSDENKNDLDHVVFLGMDFEILPNGVRGYAFVLHSELFEIDIAKFRSRNKDVYPIMVRFKAELLWSKGLNSYQWLVDKFARYLQVPLAEKISRVDLAFHIDNLDFKLSDLDRFVGKHRKDSLHRTDRKIQTLYIGSRATQKAMMRVYNKSKMILEERKKEWFFDIWHQQGMNIGNVWNVEFELHRGFLRELRKEDGELGVTTMNDLTFNLRQIWEYLTYKWLRFVDLGTATRRERCKTNEMWKRVQQGFIKCDYDGYVQREVILIRNQDSLLPALVGYVTSYCAKGKVFDIDEILERMRVEVPRYIRENKGLDFEMAVEQKYLANSEMYKLLAEEVSGRMEVKREGYDDTLDNWEKEALPFEDIETTIGQYELDIEADDFYSED